MSGRPADRGHGIAGGRNRVYVTSQQGLRDRNPHPNFLLTETYMDMRKPVILFAFLTAIYLPSYAGVSGGKAVYMGGTVADLKQETEGTFSTADVKEMVFD